MSDKEKQAICNECYMFCQEAHIDIPCKGTFDCEYREGEVENGTDSKDT